MTAKSLVSDLEAPLRIEIEIAQEERLLTEALFLIAHGASMVNEAERINQGGHKTVLGDAEWTRLCSFFMYPAPDLWPTKTSSYHTVQLSASLIG